MVAKQWRKVILIMFLLFLIFWLCTLIWGLVDKAKIAVSQANNVRRQYETLNERKKVLEANLSVLETERGRDTAIRTTFGVARPGEIVIVVVPPATTAPPVMLSWWQVILGWIW